MLVKMEGFITDAVCSCTGSTKKTDNISQETRVSCYSLKQNDSSCRVQKVGPQWQQNDAITITKLFLPTERCDNELLDTKRSAVVITKDTQHATGSLD